MRGPPGAVPGAHTHAERKLMKDILLEDILNLLPLWTPIEIWKPHYEHFGDTYEYVDYIHYLGYYGKMGKCEYLHDKVRTILMRDGNLCIYLEHDEAL